MEKEQEYDRLHRSAESIKNADSNEVNVSNLKIHYLNFAKKSQTSNFNNKRVLNSNLSKIEDNVAKLKPNLPLYCLRPNTIRSAASFFVENFSFSAHKSRILYSVKSNPDKLALKYLFESGISEFDVASISEVRLINEMFGDKTKMYFMHPIKSRESIHEAYFKYGVRDFSLDSLDELKKILEVTKNASDLGLHVRLSIPNSHAAIDLSSKFGILPSKAINLVRRVRMAAKRFGICFHVGSQCMDPIEYRNAIMITKNIVEKSKVRLDVLDVGGGFPSSYPTMKPAKMSSYFDEIVDSVSNANFGSDCEIWCEPGRALVAESTSLVVRVEGRKDSMLYLNDGTYGGLFDAGYPGFIYPVKAMRFKNRVALSTNSIPFGFYGPTCDSLDFMKGPFMLPDNIAEGDYIEIGQLGAYSRSIRTAFNGFDQNSQIEVSDEPLVSMYKKDNHQIDKLNFTSNSF